MSQIPFHKPCLGAEEIEEVVATLKSGWLTTGPKTKQFESEFSSYLGHKHAVAVNSCTAALHLALEAIGLQSQDSVIIPTMTFAATAEVVRYFGATPVLVDCRPEDFNLDVNDARKKIELVLGRGKSVSAIIPVHYGGQIGDVYGVQRLARDYKLKIIEDAAHCCPAFYQNEACPGADRVKAPTQTELISSPKASVTAADANWKRVGAGADISCYSFYANKTITTGEGGMACTDDDAYAERMRVMSLHGISKDAWKRFTSEGSWYYEIIAPGYKYNLTDIAAAIGIHQVRKADAMHRSRAKLASFYSELLRDVEELILPRQLPHRIHSWHLYVIRLRLDRLTIDRATFIAEMKRRGVATSVHWMPLHMHPYYRQLYGYTAEAFPVASSLYPEIVTLPLYPDLSEQEQLFITENVKQIIAQFRRIPRVRTVAKTLLAGQSATTI